MIAVEPISIKRNKGIGGRMNWEFDKPSEIIFRSSTYSEKQKDFPQTPSQSQEPLLILKTRYARGKISEEENNLMREALTE